jgi:hypothetical protein
MAKRGQDNETIITNALRVAAEQYDRDAAQNRREGATDDRLAATFQRQADDARDLADEIERCGLNLVEHL